MTKRTFPIAAYLLGASLASGIWLLPLAGRSEAAEVRADLVGDYVPASATCESRIRARIEPTTVTLFNNADTEALADTEMAGSGFFGPSYSGIMVVAIAEFNGHQPVTITFNPDEKKDTALMEFAGIITGNPANQAIAAANARIATLNLAKRFPLHNVPLRKCPAGPRP